MIVLAMVVVLLIVMGVAIHQKYSASMEFKTNAHGKRIAYKIAENINEISAVGDGYSQCFTIPGQITGGRYYHIVFYPDDPTAYVVTQDGVWAAPLYTVNVTCSVSPPCFTYTTSDKNMDVWVRNDKGTVFIENHGSCGGDWIRVEG